MSTDDALLWDHKVRFDDAIKGLNLDLQADAPRLKRLRAAFGMIELKSLRARIETRGKVTALSAVPKSVPLAHITVNLEAEVTQECGVSLETFTHMIGTDLEIDCIRAQDYHAPPATGEHELRTEDLDEPDIVEDGVINLGLYIIEALGEAYDPFARKPGVVFEELPLAVEPSPFAVLARLKPGKDEA